MNPTFGASILSWIPPMWTPEGGLFAIQQASAAGFDLLEILLPPSMEFDAPTVKRQLKQHGLKATCSLNLPQEAHIPFYPKEATRLIKAALDKASELEVDYLGGVLHSGIGVFSGKQRTREEENTLCEVWAEVAEYASRSGITIGIEPINRYESYMCTSAEVGLIVVYYNLYLSGVQIVPGNHAGEGKYPCHTAAAAPRAHWQPRCCFPAVLP